METTSRPLAVESFSDSWLSNAVRVPSLVNNLEFDGSFDFDTPNYISDESPAFVHADELFSNGLIKPSSTTTDSTVYSAMSVVSSRSTTTTSEYSIIKVTDNVDIDDVQTGCSCCFFWRRRKYLSEAQILKKLCGRLRPTTRRFVGVPKKSTKVDDIDRRTMEVQSWSNIISSPQTTPARPSTVYVDINESSIYEAVLHCKRSLGK